MQWQRCNPTAREISEVVNPPSDNFVGVDHSWHHDVHNITEADIRDFGRDKIVLFSFGACCEDFSKLKLLPRGDGKKPNPREPKRKGSWEATTFCVFPMWSAPTKGQSLYQDLKILSVLSAERQIRHPIPFCTRCSTTLQQRKFTRHSE